MRSGEKQHSMAEMDWLERTRRLFGSEKTELLHEKRVAVFGIGGVGGYASEVLARSGIGQIDLIDSDTVNITNLNRQIIATTDSIGKFKVDVAAERIHSINPDCVIRVYRLFYLPDTSAEFDFSDYDYVIDAVDTVAAKIAIIMKAKEAGTPVISCMGAGNKLDPTAFRVADIYSTSVCPLARTIRSELRKRGVKSLKVVFSEEPPIKWQNTEGTQVNVREMGPGSCAFVPAAAGIIIGGEVIRDLIGISR